MMMTQNVPIAAMAISVAGLITVTPAAPPSSGAQVHEIRLTSGDSEPLGGGTALVYTGSLGPVIPAPQYVDAVNTLYLEPNGFTGTLQASVLPNQLYPITGVNSLGFGASLNYGQPIMVSDIQDQIAAGGVTPENPLVVFCYSQSTAVASLVMPQLRDAGISSDLVHFVFLGDTNNPNGGLLSTFDFPAGNSLAFAAADFPFSPATPSDLYPTDIYSLEYDASADFPHYPLNLLSVLNALIGNFTQHFIYANLTPEQIDSAILLPGSAALSGEGLTDYYMIPSENLPLLMPLLLLPGIGKPLYDLLEPVTRIMVNLGYGSIDEGWNQGPANVPTTFGLFPDIDQAQLSAALSNGWQQGLTDAWHAISNPISYEEQVAPWLPFADSFYTHGFAPENPTFDDVMEGMLTVAGFPVSDVTLSSPLADIINMISSTLAYDYSALLPAADAVNALFTSLPAYAANIFADQLQAGDLLDAVGLPLAAFAGLVPFDLLLGAPPLLFAAIGTFDNFMELFS